MLNMHHNTLMLSVILATPWLKLQLLGPKYLQCNHFCLSMCLFLFFSFRLAYNNNTAT